MKETIKKTASVIADFLPAVISGTELEFFSKNNITSSQLITLMTVYCAQKYAMGELANSLHVAMPTATGLVERLVRLELVSRGVCERDRRIVYIQLTRKGRALIADFQAIVRNKWERLLFVLTSSEANNFMKVIEKLNSHAKGQRLKNEE